jgi:uncharacterized integral membrane protein
MGAEMITFIKFLVVGLIVSLCLCIFAAVSDVPCEMPYIFYAFVPTIITGLVGAGVGYAE